MGKGRYTGLGLLLLLKISFISLPCTSDITHNLLMHYDWLPLQTHTEASPLTKSYTTPICFPSTWSASDLSHHLPLLFISF